MKNKLIFLFVVLFLIGCTDVSENEILDVGENSQQENDDLQLKAMDGPYHALGFSYDETEEYLDKKSIKRAVIDVEKLAEDSKYSVIVNDEVNGNNEYYYGASSYDYIKDITEKTGVNLSASGDSIKWGKELLGFSASFSKDKEFQTIESLSTKYSFASVDVRKDVKWLQLAEDVDYLSNFLTDKFIRDVANMTSADKFVQDYGTHVLTDITIGGILRIMYTSSLIKEDNVERKKEAMKAKLNFTLKKIGLGTEINTEKIENTSTSVENKNQTLHVRYKAGEGVDGDYNLETGYPTIKKYSWEKSVTATSGGLGLTEIDWEKAYPIYEFIADPVKKQLVKEAVIRYIENKQLNNPLELKPFYRLYYEADQNCWFETEWNNVTKHSNYQSKYEWVEGYVLANSIPGETLPLYKIHWNAGKMTWYETDWNKVQANLNGGGSVYKGIDGYIYKYPKEGTIPLYRMYWEAGQMSWLDTRWEEVQNNVNGGGTVYEGIIGYIYRSTKQ